MCNQFVHNTCAVLASPGHAYSKSNATVRMQSRVRMAVCCRPASALGIVIVDAVSTSQGRRAFFGVALAQPQTMAATSDAGGSSSAATRTTTTNPPPPPGSPCDFCRRERSTPNPIKSNSPAKHYLPWARDGGTQCSICRNVINCHRLSAPLFPSSAAVTQMHVDSCSACCIHHVTP